MFLLYVSHCSQAAIFKIFVFREEKILPVLQKRISSLTIINKSLVVESPLKLILLLFQRLALVDSYTLSSVLCASIYPSAASSSSLAPLHCLSSPSLSLAPLIRIWKELEVLPSARNCHTQVTTRAMGNPLRLHDLFTDVYIRGFERND